MLTTVNAANTLTVDESNRRKLEELGRAIGSKRATVSYIVQRAMDGDNISSELEVSSVYAERTYSYEGTGDKTYKLTFTAVLDRTSGRLDLLHRGSNVATWRRVVQGWTLVRRHSMEDDTETASPEELSMYSEAVAGVLARL